MSDKKPSIPSLQGLSKDLQGVLSPIKNILESGVGDSLSKWLTENDMRGPTGILYSILSNGGKVQPAIDLDFTPPPTPTGLETAGTFSTILLAWDHPPYANHARTEIWRAAVDDLAQAVYIAEQPTGNLYADPVDDGQTYYYWIRFVSRANVIGPFNRTAGTLGQTAEEPTRILDALAGSITESHLVQALANDIDLLRGERVMKVDEYGRVVGIGMAVVDGESGPVGTIVMYADKFAIVTPGAQPGEQPKVPFVVGTIDGVSTVGINGRLVVDGSIYGYSIVAHSIAADRLNVEYLSAISANMGTVTSGTFRTSVAPAFRAEVSSVGAYPIWVGGGLKGAENAVFSVDIAGNAYLRGHVEMESGTIRGTILSADGVFTGTVYAQNIEGDVVDRVLVLQPDGPWYVPMPDYAGTVLRRQNIEIVRISAASFPRTLTADGIRIEFNTNNQAVGETSTTGYYINVYSGPRDAASALLARIGPFRFSVTTTILNPEWDGGPAGYRYSYRTVIVMPTPSPYVTGIISPENSPTVIMVIGRLLAEIPQDSIHDLRFEFERPAGPWGNYETSLQIRKAAGVRDIQTFKQASGNIAWEL